MKSIAASELIINSRGAVYHLNLRPEELASTIITVGDPERVKEVSKHFDHLEFDRSEVSTCSAAAQFRASEVHFTIAKA